MLSHLRFHRRAPSNPSEPTPDQIATWEAAAGHHHDADNNTLQPLARVSSADPDLGRTPVNNSTQSPPARSAFDGNSTGFLGGVALHQLRRTMQESTAPDNAQSSLATSLPEKRFSRTKAPPPPINTGLAARPALTAVKPSKSSKSSSFFAPTDLQLGSGGSSARPSGARGSSDTALTQPSGAPSEPAPKGRKSLPFLRNSMSSLLLRRKTSNQPPESQAVVKTPTPDVSIRGTRIHDFSAPRPKRVTPSTEGALSASTTASQVETPAIADTPGARTDPGDVGHRLQEEVIPESTRSADGGWTLPPASEEAVPPVPPKDEPAMSTRTSSSATSAATTIGAGAPLDSKASVRTTASRSFSISKLSMKSSVRSAIPKHMKSTSSRFSFDMIGAAKQEKLLEERHRMREQEKKPADDIALGQRDSRFDDFDEDFDYDAMMDDDGFEEDIPCVSMDYDIEEEEEEEDPEAAGDPDNDQENFAGFVFQRSNPASAVASPHSPAGMQLPTPRDGNGTVIGYAMTKDTTPGLLTPAFPDPSTLPKLEEAMDGLSIQPGDEPGGATLEQPTHRPTSLSVVESAPEAVPEPALESVPESQPEPVPEAEIAPNPAPERRRLDDDIYFDDGLADELDFTGDGFVIDESIFDNNDTDKYGRPIPGAFAQAQEAMRAAQLGASNRTSDTTSDPSGALGAAASTGHTSISAAAQQPVVESEHKVAAEPLPAFQLAPQPPEMSPFPGQDLAYQAALAEAAQKAAASGKFRRNSSPTPEAELTVTSPTDSAESANNLDAILDDYEKEVSFDDYEKDYDDYGGGYQDDYDFDDDAIIAEANAEALANDSDGWYGQEFGFYSAPMPQGGYGHHNNSSSGNNSNGQQADLSAENLFSYANGGYFGPAGGLGRSKSGRIVCREPNLTPITERSEYSNRNSIMSLTLPPAIGSDTGRNSLTINSPGLAQLALLGDDENSLSVAAYMKARNRAFGAGGGGSQVSSREGSPKSERGPSESPFGGHLHAGSIGHGRKGSAFSVWSSSDVGEGGGEGTASPAPQMAAFTAGGFGNNNQGANGINGAVVSPLPQRPPGIGGMDVNQMGMMGMPVGMGMGMGMGIGMGMFAPPPGVQLPVLVPSPGIAAGSGSAFACSPVLEDGEEEEEEQEERTVTGRGLAPALPVVEGVNVHGAAGEKGPGERSTGTEGFVVGEGERQRPVMGHRHKGSADSISYTMADGDEGKRWVVERRRTGETGEVEILGREVLDGGRI